MASKSSSNVERAAELLVILGDGGRQGKSLAELATALDEAKSIIHRTLTALLTRGFVEKAPGRGRYRLGPAILALARQSDHAMDQIAALRPVAIEVAGKTGHTTYIMSRSGMDAVCMEIHMGSSPVQTLVNGVGGRLPLGVGPGSVSILATFDAKSLDAVLEQNQERYASLLPNGRTDVERALERAHQLGYAVDFGISIPEVGGVARAIRPGNDPAEVTISVVTPTAQLDDARADEIIRIIDDSLARHNDLAATSPA